MVGIIVNGCTSTYNVVYHGNNNTGGDPVVDNTDYMDGETVTIMDNDGNLEKTGFVFSGWNSQADGQGTDYPVGSTFTIHSNTVLYAKWIEEDQEISRYATLKQINIKPVTLEIYSSNPSYDVGYWQDVKLDVLSLTFGEIGFEAPAYVFDDYYDLEQGTYYDIDDVEFVNLPVGEYTEFDIDSDANYFKKMISTTNTLSFKSCVSIHNFAKPTYDDPNIQSPFARTGGSILEVISHEDIDVPIDITTLTVESTGLTLSAAGFAEFDIQFIFDITIGEIPDEELYTVTYDGNGTNENVPTDNMNYYGGATVTIEDQGNMIYEDYVFNGWNTEPDGSGTAYNSFDQFMITQDTTLYAQWTMVTAQIYAKSLKHAEISGSNYDSNNVTYLSENLEYGIMQYLYVNYNEHPTLSISEFVNVVIEPNDTEAIIIYKMNNNEIGYEEVFNVPNTTSSQVAISVEIMVDDQLITACMIYIRMLP